MFKSRTKRRPLSETGIYAVRSTVEKWDADQTRWVKERSGILRPEARIFEQLKVRPIEVLHVDGNRLLDTSPAVGVQDLWKGVLGTYTQAWDQTHSGLAVGDSSTAEADNQTDLQAATNKYYEDNDSSFPALNGQNGIDMKSTFGSGIAEWAWNEYGAIIPGSSTPAAITPATTKPTNYTLYNRKVASLGTKGAGSTWTLTVTLTLT